MHVVFIGARYYLPHRTAAYTAAFCRVVFVVKARGFGVWALGHSLNWTRAQRVLLPEASDYGSSSSHFFFKKHVSRRNPPYTGAMHAAAV